MYNFFRMQTLRNLIKTPLFWLVVFSLFIQLVWIFSVGFIRDDAFITFRFSQNLILGQGFVYNLGDPVYGSSSPGFAILISLWLAITPSDPVIGALIFDVVSATLSLVIVWQILKDMDLPVFQRSCVSAVLIVSDRILARSLEGMETPLVITCMLAGYYYMSRGKPLAAGIATGLMLWLRIDSALWIPILAMLYLRDWRKVVMFLIVTCLVYLPWLIFAQIYFDSIVPFTVIAKRVAYVNPEPIHRRFILLLELVPSVTIIANPLVSRLGAVVFFIGVGLGAWLHRHSRFGRTLIIFCVLQYLALVVLNMTVEQRYFTSLIYALTILFALGLLSLSRDRRWSVVILAVYLIAAVGFGSKRAHILRDYQDYVYEGSLQQMGQWIHNNTSANSTIFLEPLGYVGYYAERHMLDEVGLITPIIVPLKRARLDSFQIAMLMNPDYVIFHCDDFKRAPKDFSYQLAVRFDPLGFNEGKWFYEKAVQRNSCYEIHRRITPPGKG